MNLHLHLWSLMLGLFAAYVALTIHEAGHLLAGRLVGFRFGLFGVGPLCVAKAGSTVTVRWLPPAHWGPFAVAYPVSVEGLSARFAWYVAGGPLASLAVALASAVCARFMPEPASRWDAWLALTSACVFIATAQPFGTGVGVPSDGRRLLRLVQNDDAGRAEIALVALDSLAAAGARPREWDQRLVDLAAGVRHPPAYALGAATALLRRALDGNDLDAARAQIEQTRVVLPRVPRWLWADAAAEAAFWFAHFQRDPTTGREFLRDVGGPLTTSHRRLRAEAAVLVRSGDLDGARTTLDRARAALDRGIVIPSSLDRDLIDVVGRDLEQALDAARTSPRAEEHSEGRPATYELR